MLKLRLLSLTAFVIALSAGYALAKDCTKKHTVTEPVLAGTGVQIACDGGYCPEHGLESRTFDCVLGVNQMCLRDDFAWLTRHRHYTCDDDECVVHYDNLSWGGKQTIDCD